ncbi:MAG: thioredoxin family protein [Phycisphaeraceae bacterium]|nr:thioredoxin family protein [Phycisphaeraceae bacterium]
MSQTEMKNHEPGEDDPAGRSGCDSRGRCFFRSRWMLIALAALVVFLLVRQPVADLIRAPQLAEAAAEGWADRWSEATEAAQQTDKPILVLWTDSRRCPPCRLMDARTWPDEGVRAVIHEHFVGLRLTPDHADFGELGGRFAISAIPAWVIISPDGQELNRHAGFMGASELQKWLLAIVE